MHAKTWQLPHGTVRLPAFFPDGTNGVVRSVDAADLADCRVEGLVMNTFHLLNKPGVSTIRSQHGLHSFTQWKRPILTDSGGFQAFSLIRENARFGRVLEDRIIFTPEAGGKKTILTPEKCIQAQYAFGSDVMMCLDHCTHPDDSYEVNAKAVDATIRWAAKCKQEFDKLMRGAPQEGPRRRLFAIIQGGGYRDLRKACAEALVGMGFEGFGFGGWPLNEAGELVHDILAYTAELMPEGSVKYAMGLGKPEEIVALHRAGYVLFDCVIPTREARHNRLYTFREEYASAEDINLSEAFYQYHYLLDDKHRRDPRPVSAICDCYCCRNYSRAYLRHLGAMGDALGKRLATIHNLRFFTMLMERLGRGGDESGI